MYDLAFLSLCDGYGGTELALKSERFERAVGRVSTVCRIERDSFAASVLVARMEEERLDKAPIWDCLESFDGAAWRGRVDIVAAATVAEVTVLGVCEIIPATATAVASVAKVPEWRK